MSDRPVGVVLAAGSGTRLRPLTDLLPKPLCPVDNVPLLDRALASVRPHVSGCAVNVHAGRDAFAAHLDGTDVHVSVEDGPEALGTAGGLGLLRDWIAGRPVLVHNGDAYLAADLGPLLADWSGDRCRLLVQTAPVGGDFGELAYVGACLLPWSVVRDLTPEPTGLYEVVWGAAAARGELDFIRTDGVAIDCGTPARYLAANLHASGGRSVVGPGARVAGELVRSVVWPGGEVAADERLVDAIRVGRYLTVDASTR